MPSKKSLKTLFPRTVGKLVATYYQHGHIHLIHPRKRGGDISNFQVAYSEDLDWHKGPRDQVWILVTWPYPWGSLFGVGERWDVHGRSYYRFQAWISYAKFKQKYKFLKRVAKTLGKGKPCSSPTTR
jgi:hypothetical protein